MSAPQTLAARVRQAVLWRSGSQIAAQTIAWASTLLVIRQLAPSDYGLFAMTQAILVLLNLMNGYGIASALIRAETVSERDWRQAFGMMLLLNGGLALAQFLLAPLAAAYYREPLVGSLLRVQALLYLATPFNALAHAMLARSMDFRRPAQVRLVASVAGAATALACAWSGWGVWTLVTAPFAIFYVEAIGMTWAARSLIRPSFRLAGSGALWRFGGTLMAAQFFWVIQTQSDVFIAGRVVDPHALGIYTTALFLTQILATKFVPPLNEVAFAAYARLHGDGGDMGEAFLQSVRLVMLVAMPAYLGLAVTAQPLVAVVLGRQWLATAAIVPVLSLAMPLLTLQIMFSPATNARGRPGIGLRSAMTGAALFAIAFLIGVRFGLPGLAWAWLVAMALLCVATAFLSMPVIGIGAAGLARAILPGAGAAAGMAAGVWTLDRLLPPLPPVAHLATLVAAGGALYLALLLLLWREALESAWRTARGGSTSDVAATA